MEDNNTEENFRHITHHHADGIISPRPNKMTVNKNLIISVIVILATVAVGGYLLMTKKFNPLKKDTSQMALSSVQLKFSEKNYKLNYGSLAKDFVVNIARFEKNEDWQGKYEFNDIDFLEGNSSLEITSKDNEKADVFLEEKLDLKKYQVFRIAVYLQTDPADREYVRLYFSNKDKTAYYAYPITNLVKGWNFLIIPKIKFSSVNAVKESLMIAKSGKASTASGEKTKGAGLLEWDKIERVGFEVVSRSNSVTTVNFDDFRALENEDYLVDDWLTSSPTFLDLIKEKDDRIILQAKNVGGAIALIKKLTGVSSFTFKAKVQPLRINTRSGLFIKGDYKTSYGYSFLIDGINGNRWQILKYSLTGDRANTLTLRDGTIKNFMVEENKPIWLKVESKGSDMKFYLSTNSKSYTMLGEINDDDIKEGGVGIVVYDGRGVTLFDDFEFSQ